MGNRQCTSSTLNGSECKNSAIPGSECCNIHTRSVTENKKNYLEVLPREILQDQLIFRGPDEAFYICEDTINAEKNPDILYYYDKNMPIYLSICKDPKFLEKLYPNLSETGKIKIAARLDWLEELKKLLKNGYTGDFYNAAHEAAKAGHLDILEYINKRYKIIIYDRRKTLLNYAILNGHVNVVEWLLNNGAKKWDIDNDVAKKVKDDKMMAYLENLGIKL